jgi:hypothetical protein
VNAKEVRNHLRPRLRRSKSEQRSNGVKEFSVCQKPEARSQFSVFSLQSPVPSEFALELAVEFALALALALALAVALALELAIEVEFALALEFEFALALVLP